MADNTITIRLNKEELAQLEALKQFYGFKGQFGEDSRTIKTCFITCLNVARMFYGESLPQLFSGIKGYKEIVEKQKQ